MITSKQVWVTDMGRRGSKMGFCLVKMGWTPERETQNLGTPFWCSSQGERL